MMGDEVSRRGLMPRPGHDGGYPYKSRGWEPVACKRESCLFNDLVGHCAAQQQFPLDEESRCTGFEARPQTEVDGD